MDMRGINGALGCLELAASLLTREGQLLADTLRADFVEDLIPRYHAFKRSARRVDALI